MRNRSVRIIPISLIAGAALALPIAAQATTGATTDPGSPQRQITARRAATVTLPTGQHLRITGKAGSERVLVDHTGASPGDAHGPGSTMVVRRDASHTYVLPAVAEKYLGRFLDPRLFDVTTLASARTGEGRIPVRISYTGARPTVPGIQVTSATGGTARGYLTPTSAVAFGRALTSAWKADSRAGAPRRTALFPGVGAIAPEAAAPGVVRPHFPMNTLIIKSIDADGNPQPFSFTAVMNVDDGRKYVGFALGENGEARISVPAGTYSLLGDDYIYDEASGTGQLWITGINEYVVKKPGQTVTIDQRKATAVPSVSVPARATVRNQLLEIDRVDALDQASLGSGYFLDPSVSTRVSPLSRAKVGKLYVTQNWDLVGPGAKPAYAYTLGSLRERIPASLVDTFRARDLATVKAAYYGDGGSADKGFIRSPMFPGAGGGGTYERIPSGIRRTDYVGAIGGRATWYEGGLLNYDSWDDPGFIDGPEKTYPAGTTGTSEWFRGPFPAAIPVQSGDYGWCLACRAGDRLSIGLAGFTDADPTHIGSLFGAEDGLPVARFRFYRNGSLVSDEDDTLGGTFAVPAGSASYRAVLDVDRRLTAPAQSTRTHTELTFGSAAGAGPALSSDWYCDNGEEGDGTTGCRVLPVLQARAGLPTDLNGRLPAGRSTVTVTLARIQGAASAAVSSASLEFRPAGWSWSSVELTPIGNGQYRGVIDNTGYDGSDVDLRIGGADAGGSAVTQTILHAYTVAGSR